MKGLIIKDRTHWCDSWSADLATQMEILDSSYNLLIFHERHAENEILGHIHAAPRETFQIVDLVEAQEACCDLISDNGICYRIVESCG